MSATQKTPVQATPDDAQKGLAARLSGSNTLWTGLVLVALCLLFSALRPDAFPTLFNIQTLLVQAAPLLMLAVGMTFVIITSGIDLSVGSVLVFAGVVSAQTMEALSGGDATHAGWGVIAAGLVVALAGGAVWGVLNGLLVAVARVPALIVTLGSFGAALGAAQLLTNGIDVRTVPTALRQTLGTGTSFGVVPNLVILAAVVTLLGAWLLHTTVFGRYTYAIGSNAEAARRSGIRVTRHLVAVYALTGVLSGLAGFMSLAYFGTTTISGHSNDNLNAIAAVVLGGTSLFGGVGTVLGSVIGVFIPAVLDTGFVMAGVRPFWQPIAVGAVLVAAVWMDQRRRRARNSR
ncbi:monosaccharide ABC transporter membrane protein (CUT2 family) [Saccharopolyspora erythraea NRRL 2338]|uniref:Ribose ABC transporter, permease protein n=2 Tax=Saccharopolyspora erythraea TaxID=1836 RepID=A4FMX7_SACEN|nr:ABC transporter permease [Saccharopolyspora erythraea]EQD84925.1 sugar ABC transporter permease [Saccharopolyspora erythraea D]PFG99046.1 monosaccharide ABC transporter membrane protein (CUT2 family) [Saccharopolyspora erythraea NRRL 2338]QRK89009.1 ABC transporter permease [Saccharopolyspora erythraea]CAM05402.1 ribose ABC transporter, permease protein [Saccharopolyspora erythraea NRRL 2338]